MQLGAIGRRQQSVFSIEQLREAGFTDDRVSHLVAAGRLRRQHRGVYCDALVSLTPRSWLFAAQLSLGSSSFLSHRTAAALLGLRAINRHAVEITVTAEHTPRRAGLTVHRILDPPEPDELRAAAGLRHSSAARVLLELALPEDDRELDRLIAEMARRRLLDLDRIDAALARRGRVPGRAKLVAALGRYRPPGGENPHLNPSTFERAFAAWLTTHPEIPSPQRNVRLGPWELDFLWPEQRLVVETDGAQYHLTPTELERDRVKDAWLQRRELRIMRVTGFRFDHDRPGILGDLTGMLHLG